MDARERLQRYLEQRRDAGESELVLDRLSVDEVMALVGLRPSSSKSEPPLVPKATSNTVPNTARASEVPSASGTESRSVNPPADHVSPVESPQRSAPPQPTSRVPATSSTDWRKTLRDANAGMPTPSIAAEHTAGASSANAGAGTPQPSRLPDWLEKIGLPRGLSVGRDLSTLDAARRAFGAPRLDELNAIADGIAGCTRCALHQGARRSVPGAGNPQAELVCVGEGPGVTEEEQGLPFAGESGELLTRILQAIGIDRDAAYLCNVVNHRPPGNRDPLPDEVTACTPWLQNQLMLVQPKVILALGRTAAQSLLNTTSPLSELRGHVHFYHGIPVIATYHPAALLRDPAWRRPTWEDVKHIRNILDRVPLTDSGSAAR